MNNRTVRVVLLATAFLVITSSCRFNFGNATANANVNINVANIEPSGGPDEVAAAGAESKPAAAEALIADLYKAHDAKKGPFFQTKSRALVDKYFTKSLADLIWKDANESKGEVGAIDADPLYNAQDVEIKNFAIGQANVKGESAAVPVSFTNFGEKQTITFALKLTGDAWKIDDIKFSADDSLRKWLTGTYANTSTSSSSSGEFEGRYQVGDTTCTVKPVKMAFEVRWAKGSGIEAFFSTSSTTFESDPAPGEQRNAFVFDDENYNEGTFERADGKTFTVRRIR